MYTAERIDQFQTMLHSVKEQVAQSVVGLPSVVDGCLIAILANGHVLLEGVPGLGKTMLVQSLGKALDLRYSRIQFTPDLMPADITGTNIVLQDPGGKRFFEFQEGPIFAQLILADEINRATSKTQAALLEAMQERTVTAGGSTRQLADPFFVMATQNPIEMEGTYPLPEAQVDRFFFKLTVAYHSLADLNTILVRTTGTESPQITTVLTGRELVELQMVVRSIPVSNQIIDYAARLVMTSHPTHPQAPDSVKGYVRYGASPRGAQTLILAAKAHAFLTGRYSVGFDDVKAVALPALRHRILLNFTGEAANLQTDALVSDILNEVKQDGGGH